MRIYIYPMPEQKTHLPLFFLMEIQVNNPYNSHYLYLYAGG